MLVTVPVPEASICTATPGSGSLVSDVTIPFISRICADRVVTANKKNPNRSPFFNREMSLQNEWVSWSFILLLVLV